MNCPVCHVALTMMERQGVEIDYCQRCRGVWLDRGELDKIIERAAGQPTSYSNRSDYENRGYSTERRDDDYRYQQQQQHHYPHKKKKREGFLSELFDFD